MTVLDPYNLLPQGFGLMAWNADINYLMAVGDRIGACMCVWLGGAVMSIESQFIDQVTKTTGAPFLALATKIDVQVINDFIVGRLIPQPTDMTKFIDALGLFNRLTMCEVAA